MHRQDIVSSSYIGCLILLLYFSLPIIILFLQTLGLFFCFTLYFPYLAPNSCRRPNQVISFLFSHSLQYHLYCFCCILIPTPLHLSIFTNLCLLACHPSTQPICISLPHPSHSPHTILQADSSTHLGEPPKHLIIITYLL